MLLKIFYTLILVTLLINYSNAQSVSITNPNNGDSFTIGSTINVSTTTSTSGLFLPSITKVVFTLTSGATTLTFTDINSPYTTSFSTSALPAGTYTLTAAMTYTSLFKSGVTSDSETITITAPTPTTPVDINTATANSVPENSANGTLTGLTAFSSDPNGLHITYSLTNDAGGRFTIDPATGIVSVANGTLLDYETNTSHTITVQASNGTTTSSQNFTIAVTNVNEAPVITSNGGGATASVSVVEGSTAVTTNTATDVDAGSTQTYSISGGADAAKFTINSSTGALAFVSAPSFTSLGSAAGTNAYLVNVTVTDNGSPTLTDVQNLTVNLTALSFLTGYAYRKPIILNNNLLGITNNQTSFPALLSITDNALKIVGDCTDKVQYPNGPSYDFAFTAGSGGSELNYQVESYDKTNGVLLVWVQIPSLTALANNSLYFYFGSISSPAATHTTAFYGNTWPGDYKAVYHFNEAAYTGSVTDATSASAHTGTTNGMTSADLVAGKIGNAYSFDGTTKSISANAVTITGNFTLSAWVKLTTLGKDQKIMTNQATAGSSTGGYKLGVYTDNTAESESGAAVNRASTPNSPIFATGVWHYVQSVYTGATLSTYVDGAQYRILTTSTSPTSTTPFYIGVGEGGAQLYFYGLIDEPRVSNVAKSIDWIKAEYVNQNNPITYTDCSGVVQTNTTNGALIPGMVFTWTGATSMDPSVTTNWNNTTAGLASQTPAFTGTATLIVPVVGTSKYPKLTADISIYGLTIASGASVDLNGHTLSVGCNIYNNANTGGTGIFDGTGSTTSGITFGGKLASQTYTGTNTASTDAMGNMTIANTAGGTVTITGGPVEISNLLTLTQGNLVIDNTNNGGLTLKDNISSNLNYAQIASITSGYTISGPINYQVYFTGVRNYRSMASPVYNNTNTYSAANGTYTLGSLMNPAKPAENFIITGSGGPTNGFDKSSNNGATLRLYNVASNIYTFVTSISSSTPVVATGAAFYMYFRGSRIPGSAVTAKDPFGTKTNRGTGSYAPADAVTYTYTGVPNQGNVTSVPAFGLNDTRFYFLANPYAATLDANAIIAAAPIKTSIWIWNPSGNYAVYNSTSPGLTANGGARYIVPGQGFFIQAATAATVKSLTITESMKSVTNNLNAARMLSASEPATTVDLPIFRLKFIKDSVLSDEIAVAFKDSSKATIDYNDATHLEGTNLTLSSVTTDNQYLAIDVRPFVGKSTAMQLYITPELDTTYTLKLSYKNAAINNYKISLKDSLLNTTTDISNSAYSFSVASGQANTYAKRFKLIIEQQPAPALFTKFTGKLNELKKVLLNWNGTSDRSNIVYQVQRSTDKKSFTNIGQSLYSLADNSAADYQTMDTNPATGANYYRLVQTDLFNNAVYSDTVMIANNPGLLNGIAKNGFILYPNAVKDVLSVVSDKDYNSKVTMTIFDAQGNLKLTQSYQGISAQLPVQQDVNRFQLGVYIMHLTSNGKELVTLKFNKEQN